MATNPRHRSDFDPNEHTDAFNKSHPKPSRIGKGTEYEDERLTAESKDRIAGDANTLALLAETVGKVEHLQRTTDEAIRLARKREGEAEAITRLFGIQRRNNAKKASVEADAQRITEDATSGNPIREAKAKRQSEGLSRSVDKFVTDAIEAQDREIEGLREEVRDIKENDVPALHERIDTEHGETDRRIKPLEDHKEAQQQFNQNIQGDVAKHEDRITRQAAVTTAFPVRGLLISLAIGAAIGFVVFLIRIISGSGFTANVTAPDGTVFTTMIEEPGINRFWNSVVLGLAFGSITAFIASIIVVGRYIAETREATTATSEQSEETEYAAAPEQHNRLYYLVHPGAERPVAQQRHTEPVQTDPQPAPTGPYSSEATTKEPVHH